jgi:hypothetical protein
MFTFMTIITLLAPAVLAPLGCLVLLRAIGHAEASRRASRISAPSAQITLDPTPVPVPAEHGLERQAA